MMEIHGTASHLTGRKILVTGVSRPSGIGPAIVRMLAEAGASVVFHGFSGYDAELKYGDADLGYAGQLASELAAKGLSAHALPGSDLSAAGEPERVVAAACELLGYLDGLVLNHAYSTCVPIGKWTAEHIDMHLAVNVRAVMLMIQAFAGQLPQGMPGAVTLFTSGQYLGPMTKEIAYAVSKEAILCLCRQAAAALAGQGIRVNCVNPGPTDTGYLTGAEHQAVAELFPAGRWGMPEDAARLVRFLHSDDAAWITGQVIASEGGFRRR